MFKTKSNITKSLIGLSVGAAVVLSSCSGDGKTVIIQVPASTIPTTTVAPTTTEELIAPPTTISRATLEAFYVDSVRSQTTNLWSLSDSDILELGRLTCAHFQSGGTNQDLLDMIIAAAISNGTSEGAMMDVAGATGIAVAILCPEYSWKLG